jgi:hypothetical protein
VVTSAWVIRAGRAGERDAWALQHGVSGGGWKEVSDLTGCTTKEQIAAAVHDAFPNAKPGMLNNFIGQLVALRIRIAPGALLVMPMKTTRQIAFGLPCRRTRRGQTACSPRQLAAHRPAPRVGEAGPAVHPRLGHVDLRAE